MRTIAHVGAARCARSGAATVRRRRCARARAPAITSSQRRDVGQAEVQTLPGQRMHDVRGVAEQHPARAAPGGGARQQQRPGGALGARLQLAGLAAGGAASARARRPRRRARAARRRARSGSDQTSA